MHCCFWKEVYTYTQTHFLNKCEQTNKLSAWENKYFCFKNPNQNFIKKNPNKIQTNWSKIDI